MFLFPIVTSRPKPNCAKGSFRRIHSETPTQLNIAFRDPISRVRLAFSKHHQRVKNLFLSMLCHRRLTLKSVQLEDAAFSLKIVSPYPIILARHSSSLYVHKSIVRSNNLSNFFARAFGSVNFLLSLKLSSSIRNYVQNLFATYDMVPSFQF